MEKEFYLLGADYEDDRREVGGEERTVADIKLFGRKKDGESIVAIDRSFDPYFYVVPEGNLNNVKETVEDFEENGLEVKKVEVVEKMLGKEAEKVKALKVFSYHPSDLSKIRDKVKKMEGVGKGNCYGFGMNFYRRYLIDKGLKPSDRVEVKGEKENDSGFDISMEVEEVNPVEENGGIQFEDVKTMAFDIETYEESKESKITMLSIVSEDLKKVLTYEGGDYKGDVEVVGEEKELIERFVDIVREEDPDFLITYNGDEFDFQILRERAEDNNLELNLGRNGEKMKFMRRARVSSARISGRVHIDLYRFVDQLLSRQLETEVLSLNEVASEILGESKIDMGFEEIFEKWREKEELSKLAEYCLRDSEITSKLAEQLLPQINELSRVSGQLPFDCSRMTYGQLVEWYLLRRAYPERIAPNRPKWEEIQERRKQSPYKGGFVKEPNPGIHESVTILDFQSLYPTIIVSYNISPETMGCDHDEEKEEIPGKDIYFCQREQGFIPSILEDLIVERGDVKERLQNTEKGTLEYRNLDNRQYALKVLANSVYGYYGYVGARWYSRECAESITALGRKWIKEVMKMAQGGGFEVIYGDTDSLMIRGEETEGFLEDVNSKLPGIMNLELEGKFRRGIFVSKEKGKGAKKRYALVDEEGNLKIRGFETVRRDWCELAKRTQRKILEKVLIENSRTEAIKYGKGVVKKLCNKEVELRDLIIYTQLTKPVDEYKSTSPHVEAAKKLKREGKAVGAGSVIMYVITEGSGSISKRAKPLELTDLEEVDTEYYIKNQVVPAALRVLKVVGVDEEELLGKGSQESLGDFTG